MTTFDIELAPDGRIVDFLDGVPLADTPHERVRQRVLRRLHVEQGYPKTAMRRGVAIVAQSHRALGDDATAVRADIVVYRSPPAGRRGDQGAIELVVACAPPGETDDHGRLVAAILATGAPGGVWTDGDGDVRAFRRSSSSWCGCWIPIRTSRRSIQRVARAASSPACCATSAARRSKAAAARRRTSARSATSATGSSSWRPAPGS